MLRLIIKLGQTWLGRTRVKIVLAIIVAQVLLYLMFQQGVSPPGSLIADIHNDKTDVRHDRTPLSHQTMNASKAKGDVLIQGNAPLLGHLNQNREFARENLIAIKNIIDKIPDDGIEKFFKDLIRDDEQGNNTIQYEKYINESQATFGDLIPDKQRDQNATLFQNINRNSLNLNQRQSYLQGLVQYLKHLNQTIDSLRGPLSNVLSQNDTAIIRNGNVFNQNQAIPGQQQKDINKAHVGNRLQSLHRNDSVNPIVHAATGTVNSTGGIMDKRGEAPAAIKRQKYKSQLLAVTDPPVMSRGCEARGSGLDVTSMVFVKVHKSASTTVANILARYALRHLLNVALPYKLPGTNRFNYFDDPITSANVFPLPTGESYHVMFNHMIFRRHNIQRIMPNNTFYFASMREPEERFISSLLYYEMAHVVQSRYGLGSVEEAVKLILRYPALLDRKPEYYNSLAGDTGLHPFLQSDPKSVQEHIVKVEQDIDLMLVVEYFDESLVLLKRKACLAMKDILYVKKNARYNETSISLTPEDRERFRKLQMADVMMYRHFYKRFWTKVLNEGPDFFQEVRTFKEIQRGVTDFCSQVVSVWDFHVVAPTVWSEEFLVTARECRLMRMTELQMQMYLIKRATVSHMVKRQNEEQFSDKGRQYRPF